MAASLPWRRDEKPAEISWLASDPGGTGPADHATSDDPRRYRVGTISTSNAIRAFLFDPLVGPGIVAVEVVIPANRGGVDEALDEIRVLLDQLAPRLDQGRIGRVAVVGEQEDVRPELALLLDLVGLSRDIALLDRRLVLDEGCGIEIVWSDVLDLEAVGERQPVVERVDRAGSEVDLFGLRQILPLVQPNAWMRHQDLRALSGTPRRPRLAEARFGQRGNRRSDRRP